MLLSGGGCHAVIMPPQIQEHSDTARVLYGEVVIMEQSLTLCAVQQASSLNLLDGCKQQLSNWKKGSFLWASDESGRGVGGRRCFKHSHSSGVKTYICSLF